jgi:hypothetical protein
MRARKKASARVADPANAGRALERSGEGLKSEAITQPSATARVSLDCRAACGVVVISARGAFTAIDTNGNVIGRFSTLREAATSLPNGGAS